MTEIAVELAGAGMDEEQLIAIAVAHEMIHVAGGALPETQLQRAIAGDLGRLERRGPGLRRQCRKIEGVRPQRPLELNPAGGRMTVIKMSGGAKEAVLAHLPLERAGRQVRMRLARGDPGDVGVTDVVLHGRQSPNAGPSGNLVSDETIGKRAPAWAQAGGLFSLRRSDCGRFPWPGKAPGRRGQRRRPACPRR